MFVDNVSLESYAFDYQEDLDRKVSNWNNHIVEILNSPCGKTVGISLQKLHPAPTHEIKPMMTRCTGSVEYDPDTGKIIITGSAEFETSTKDNESNSKPNNDAEKGTNRIDNDPPDSKDREK